ncbi:hypothetical protein ACHAXN_010174 [Cyclotella atomus]
MANNEEESFMSLDESSIAATPSFRHTASSAAAEYASGTNPLAAANPLDLFSPSESINNTNMSISQMDCATPRMSYGLSPKLSRVNNGNGARNRNIKLSVDTRIGNNGRHAELNSDNVNHGPPAAAAEGEVDNMDESITSQHHNWDIEEARIQLRQASLECGRRGLKIASCWASEQLVGLAPPPSTTSSQTTSTSCHSETMISNSTDTITNDEIYASSLFNMGEYSRCVHALSEHSSQLDYPHDNDSVSNGKVVYPPKHNLSSMGIYLRAFALYLEGERKQHEEMSELRDALEGGHRSTVRNRYLPILEVELRKMYQMGRLDSFGLYVYGVVLKGLRGRHQHQEDLGGHEAHEILIQSILKYPYNWSAWLDLAELCIADPSIDRSVEKLLMPVSTHWMYHFFCVHVFIENKANENAIAAIDRLVHGPQMENNTMDDAVGSNSANNTGFFVQSAYLQTQLAMAYYDVRDYDSAHEHFLALSDREPYRLDHMDAFSNVLYVKDQKVALSHLAHRSMSVDKFRPETCIIVGNYYSSKGRHEKAVQYFQRALKLDRNYLSAWTLLGHEYIEMKNTAAAIEAYRRAVDISDREYRAWYGLGQTYEIMNMLLHALFYFRKAAALHPHDARMWCAIGGCLLGLDRRSDAEKSYERAVSLGDGEGIATRKLAELYREDGDEEKAAKCYVRHLELRYHSQLSGSYTGAAADSSPEALENVVKHVRVDEPEAEALLYLAYYYRDNLEYDVAIICATRLEDYPGPEKEQGKSLLRDIRSRMDQQAGGRRDGRGYPPRSPTTPSMNLRGARGGTDLSMDTSVNNAESSFEFSP